MPLTDKAGGSGDADEAESPDNKRAAGPWHFPPHARNVDAAGTADDVVKVAYALEGMEYDSIWGSKVMMRPNDHQAIQDVHIQEHTNEGISFPYDGSEYGVKVIKTVEMASADAPSSCEMEKP